MPSRKLTAHDVLRYGDVARGWSTEGDRMLFLMTDGCQVMAVPPHKIADSAMVVVGHPDDDNKVRSYASHGRREGNRWLDQIRAFFEKSLRPSAQVSDLSLAFGLPIWIGEKTVPLVGYNEETKNLIMTQVDRKRFTDLVKFGVEDWFVCPADFKDTNYGPFHDGPVYGYEDGILFALLMPLRFSGHEYEGIKRLVETNGAKPSHLWG